MPQQRTTSNQQQTCGKNKQTCHSYCINQITKLLYTSEQIATLMTIRTSFQKAGLSPDSGTKPFKLHFQEESLRENPGLKELWGQNVSIEELS
jgi:hypothetical protein